MAQQLAICTSQIEELLNGMGSAVSAVRDLTLTIDHRTMNDGTSSAESCTRKISKKKPGDFCLSSYALLSRTVCTTLAAAVPVLQSLKIMGCCRDWALAAFGSSCPGLTHFEVEACFYSTGNFPRGIAGYIPQLTKVTVTHPQLCSDESVFLTKYVDELLRALQPSTLLTSFCLNFSSNLAFGHDGAALCRLLPVPPNLHNLDIGCEFHGIHNATRLLRNLKWLSVSRTDSFNDLFQILRLAPSLQAFYYTSDWGWFIWCDHEDMTSNIHSLRERLLRGLRVYVPCMIFDGDGDGDVQAVLALLPPLPDVHCIELHAPGDHGHHPEFLSNVARVFPCLKKITLGCKLAPGMAEIRPEMLDPLVACTSLTSLMICDPVSRLNTSDLVTLCLRMPALKVLHYMRCDGVCLSGLQWALAAQRRVMDVHESSL